MSQQVWHVKEPSLLKAMSAKHGSEFAALSSEYQLMIIKYRKIKVYLIPNQSTSIHSFRILLDFKYSHFYNYM
jgi:hypothetical protein